MSLPVQACTDDELEDYAAIHPEAAEELARRIVTGKHAREMEMDELRAALRDSEEEHEETGRELSELKGEVESQIVKLRALLDDYSVSDDLEDEINRIANRLEGEL